MSSLCKRGAVWVLRWWEAGRQRRRSTGVRVAIDPSGQIAKQVQRDFDSRRAREGVGLEDAPLTVTDALARWLATKRQTVQRWQEMSQARGRRWAAWLAARHIELLSDITPEHISDWIEERTRAGASRKTIRIEVDQIRAVARLANRTRRVRPIPVETWPTVDRVIAARPDRIGAYTAEEVEAIIEDLGRLGRRQQWATPVLLLAHLGCRWSELAALRAGDINLASCPPVVRIESRKTARTTREQFRFVEVHPRIIPVLSSLVAGRPKSEPLLVLPDSHNATNILRRCCARLGIQYRRLHGLRHYWITSLLAAGAPLAAVMQMAGHRHLSTTQGYLHLPSLHVGWVGRAIRGKTED